MAKFDNYGFITALEPKEIFVFGSNLEGHHIGGAARQAYEDFGAVWGIGVGLQGQSYGIPTMPPLTIKEIAHYIAQFVEFARLTPGNTYYVTPIGTGIAQIPKEQMHDMWSSMKLSGNIKLLF